MQVQVFIIYIPDWYIYIKLYLLFYYLGKAIYDMINYPLLLPQIFELEICNLRYPIKFQPNQGHPKQEKHYERNPVYYQKYGQCYVLGIYIIFF